MLEKTLFCAECNEGLQYCPRHAELLAFEREGLYYSEVDSESQAVLESEALEMKRQGYRNSEIEIELGAKFNYKEDEETGEYEAKFQSYL